MSHVHEFRVRPVSRFIVTEFRREDDGANQSGGTPRSLAELPNAVLADELAAALHRANPGSTLVTSEGEHKPAEGQQFVVVEAHCYRPETVAFYAASQHEAVIVKTNAEMTYGREFRVFSRQGPEIRHEPGGEAPARFVADKLHAQHFSRYAVGERVIRVATNINHSGPGQHGVSHHFAAEEAEICGVHIYPSKICYDVTFPSGRHAETVDSLDLQDLPAPQSTTVPQTQQ